MPLAARVTDMHVCPLTTGPVPHVGGPILPPGVPTVMIGKMPAATVTNMCTCVGPPDLIVKGSMGVMINKLPAARMGDTTVHGGTIVLGCPTVIIGETHPGGGAPSPVVVIPIIASLMKAAKALRKTNKPAAVKIIQEAILMAAATEGKPFVSVVEKCNDCNPK